MPSAVQEGSRIPVSLAHSECTPSVVDMVVASSEDLTQLSVMFTNQVQQSEQLQPGQHNPLAAHYLARAHEVNTARKMLSSSLRSN